MTSNKHAVDIKTYEPLTINLNRLMNERGINEAELARRTNTPQPTIHKLLSGKTEDPRVSTLKTIAEFFGISIDELLSGTIITRKSPPASIQSVPIISWEECLNSSNFIKNLNPDSWNNWVVCEFLSENLYCLLSKPSMEPRFPRGTRLIIDPMLQPEDGDTVIVHFPNTKEATLREISSDGPLKLLLPVGANAAASKLEADIRLLGVLIKSMFLYHMS